MSSFFEVKVDALGRITIPAKVRRWLGIDIYDKVVIDYDNDKIEIRKKDVCLINNNIKNILDVADNTDDLTVSEYKQLQVILAKLQG